LELLLSRGASFPPELALKPSIPLELGQPLVRHLVFLLAALQSLLLRHLLFHTARRAQCRPWLAY
jgi:hypothetical protein